MFSSQNSQKVSNYCKKFKDFWIKAERKAKSGAKTVAKGDEHPRFAARREPPGFDNKNNPTLKASNKSARLLLAFSEPLNYFLLTQRYSPGGEAGMFVAFGDLI
ncbi:MAG TPA: hypothetical protein VF644_11260 [Pyrinomonadaceae bacterium]|jgi:hypothetical protein